MTDRLGVPDLQAGEVHTPKQPKGFRLSAKLVFGAVVLVYGGFFINGLITNYESQTAIEQNFAPVLAGLDQYRQDFGGYPEALTELVPRYISAVPGCPTHLWPNASYHRLENGTYSLTCMSGFILGIHQGLVYDSKRKKWEQFD